MTGNVRFGDEEPATPARQLSDDQKRDWLRLIRSENVGPRTFRALVNRYGGAGEALRALPELSARGGLRRKIHICPQEDAEKEIRLAEKRDLTLVAAGEAHYPLPLGFIEDAPPLLFVRGQSGILIRPMVAMVGSRNCSAAGARFASQLAEGLGQADIVTVSGLARGIDGAVHKTSLSHGTVAVLAGGADTVYPDEHTDLAGDIATNGALISEMPVGYRPRGQDFPRRNRIISGMALGTIVVEAAKRSGTLITARLAGEQGREVFAVPGSPLDPRAQGTNKLIQDGAHLVTNVADVLDVLRPLFEDPGRLPRQSALDEDELAQDVETDVADSVRQRVHTAVGVTPVEIDEIIRHTGLPAGPVLMILLELELAGRLERHSGQRVSLIP